MIEKKKWLACAALACTAAAQAQHGVEVYGSIDVAVGWIDDVRGSSLKRLDSGSLYANRLGFRGREDLGDRLAALFVLESGFNADDGTLTLGGRTFGRQSFVGLAHPTWGTLTLGRQYDFLYAGSPLPLDVGALLIGGLAGASGGAGTGVDNHSGGVRHDNSAKWVGRWGAWTLGLMGGLGVENGNNEMASAAVSYRNDGLWAGIGYVHDDYSAPTAGNTVTLAGLNWDLMSVHKLIATVSTAKADVAADRRSKTDMVQLGWLTRIGGPWRVGAMIGHARIRTVAGAQGQLRQYGLGAQYALSKRTDLYAIGSLVDTQGAAGTAYSGIPGIGAPAANLRSSDDTQRVLRLGLLHRF